MEAEQGEAAGRDARVMSRFSSKFHGNKLLPYLDQNAP